MLTYLIFGLAIIVIGIFLEISKEPKARIIVDISKPNLAMATNKEEEIIKSTQYLKVKDMVDYCFANGYFEACLPNKEIIKIVSKIPEKIDLWDDDTLYNRLVQANKIIKQDIERGLLINDQDPIM